MKSELLIPAGGLEKLKTAIIFGADAVYFGLPGFSLRARASQFSRREIREGVEFCRKHKKKFYVALNIYAHNIHLKALEKQLEFVKETQPDGIILSDPGILQLVKEKLPKIDVHLSTQANVTNKEAVKFWAKQGVKRIVLAREVSLKEVREIKKAVPKMELEYFVHGAMCMAYSGRCILSKWFLDRSGNLGDCAQPCRWKYKNSYHQSEGGSKPPLTGETVSPPPSLTAKIVDDKDRFEIDIEEDGQGTYLFNSNDICLIDHLKEIQEAGIDSLKVEGRTKSVYYTAMVARAYRKALDSLGTKEEKKVIKEQRQELEKLSNRGYWTGFAFQNEPPHLFKEASKNASMEFVGIGLIKDISNKSDVRNVFVHNHFLKGEEVEVVTPVEIFKTKVLEIKNDKGESQNSAHGGQKKVFSIKFDKEIEGFFVIRKKL